MQHMKIWDWRFMKVGASNFLEETLSKCLPEAIRLTLTRVCEKEQSDTERLTHFWEQLGQVFLSGYDLQPCNLLLQKVKKKKKLVLIDDEISSFNFYL